jgi:hypothetical protein
MKKKRKSRSDRLDNLVDSLSHIYCTENTSRSHRLPAKLTDMITGVVVGGSSRSRAVSSAASTTATTATFGGGGGKKRARRTSSTATMSTSNNEDEYVDVDEVSVASILSPNISSLISAAAASINKTAREDSKMVDSLANENNNHLGVTNAKKKNKKRIKLEESVKNEQPALDPVPEIEVFRVEM